LRLITTRSAGYDHIDLEYCQKHGITVCNVPDYGDATVAEHAFALLLAVSRHLIEAVERTKRGDFSQSGLRGFELRGKTLGVIGTGRIGSRAIEIGKGFGMTVLAFDVHQDTEAARDLGFEYGELLDVLRRSDVVTLHVPANPHTRHLISDAEFGAMKASTILVNTARGSIVDTEALVRALSAKRIRGAGLDVLPSEPLIRDESQVFRSDRTEFGPDERALLADHALLRFPNVVVTPHIAFNTGEALRRIVDTTLANIRAFVRDTPQNVVSGPRARLA
jgi:D-lactate dehydrogenase